MKSLRNFTFIGLIFIIGNTFISCEKKDVEKRVWESTNISYLLTMSPDLLKFVYPEVTYVDSEGIVHTISGVEELDNLVNTGFAYAPGIGVWTFQTIKGTNYKCWNLNMTFGNRPFHSYMGVKYKKLDFVEDTTGVVYDFHHSIFSTTIYVNSTLEITTTYNYWSQNTNYDISYGTWGQVENHISFTKDCYYNGGEVEQYVNELVNTPDKVGFYIDSDGSFKENEDFIF